MIARVFDVTGILLVVGIAVIAFLIPVIVGAVRRESGIWRGIEGAVLALLGGVFARLFISLLMGSANDSPGAGLAIGWGFFLVPGLIDTFTSQPVLTTPEVLLIFAGVVGGFTGMMAGIYQIYDWLGLGWIAFPLDVTWALAGNTVGSLLHIVNIGWGDHGAETRENAHRYASGFGLRYHPAYAFTQGCVMSNLSDGPGKDLFRHERTHVWQNRGFGPFFTLTYVGWMLVWIVPAAVAGVIVKGIGGIVAGPNNWCYFNNPWETWAYAVQGVPRTNIDGVDDGDKKMIWPAKYVIAWSIPYFAIVTALAIFIVFSVWTAEAPAPHKSHHPTRHSQVRQIGPMRG